MLVVTHCHLAMMVKRSWQKDRFDPAIHMPEIESIVHQAAVLDVGKIITVATTLPDSLDSIFIAQKIAGVFATVGIHPCDYTSEWKNDFAQIKKLVCNKKENKIVGIGETGLDFYHKPFNKQKQIDVFRAHIELSLEYNLPLVIHVRESVDDVLRVLGEYKKEVGGVFHCFCQSKEVARTIIDWGMYIGIGGPITYPKNEYLRELIREIGLERIVLETDAPFLPPQQFRGKRNHPQYIPLIAQAIADIKGIKKAVVADATTKNVERLFGISHG